MRTLHEPWKMDMTALAVIYAMLERNKRFPLLLSGDDAFFEPVLDEMYRADYLNNNGREWIVTSKGRQLRQRMIAMFDQVLQFEPLSAFDLGRSLREDEYLDDNNQAIMVNNKFDPRCVKGTGDMIEDLRIATMLFLAETGQQECDPHRIAFMQQGIDGAWKSDDFLFRLRLGSAFEHVEQIVQTAYKWRDLAPGDEAQARTDMETIYRAGMMEQRKREGNFCPNCALPLGMYEAEAKTAGEKLIWCPDPDCNHSFRRKAQKPKYQCPNCSTAIHANQRRCRGCSARIDRSLPPGTIETSREIVTTVTEDVLWMSYDYTPVYYDYWDIQLAVDVFTPVWCPSILIY